MYNFYVMKLIEFNTSNSSKRHHGNSSITISKEGLLSFSTAICNKINLNDKSKVKFYQEQDDSVNWYFKVTNDDDGFQLRRLGTSGRLGFNSAKIAANIRESLNVYGTMTVPVGIEPEEGEYWPLITSSVNNR